MSIYFLLYFMICSYFILNSCSSESIPALLLKEDVIGKLAAPGDLIGTFINGVSKNMNGTMNIPLVVDLMQSETDWMKPTQSKDKSSKNSRISKFKMHSYPNQDRNEEMTAKSLFDNSLGHKSKSEKEILNELKQSLGIMMKKPSFENRRTSWKTKPVQPKNEKLGEIDVTEPNEYSNDENNDDDDSFGNEDNNSLKDLQTLETPKYTTERFLPTKRRQYANNRVESKERKTNSNGHHDIYYGQPRYPKLNSQTPIPKTHHETMLSIDDILKVLDKISTDIKHEKDICDYKENDNNNQIGQQDDGEQQMLLKNLKNYFGLIDLKDKLGVDPASSGIFEENSPDTLDEEEPVNNSKMNNDGGLIKTRPQIEHDDKASANIETNELNSFYRNLTDVLMSSKSSGNMNSLINLIRNIDNYQKSSLGSAPILDSRTNFKINEDTDDCVDSSNQHSQNSARSNENGFTNDAEILNGFKDNKKHVQSSGASIKRNVPLEERKTLIDDLGKTGKQSVITANSKVSNDYSKDEQLVESKGEAQLNPTQHSGSPLAHNHNLDENGQLDDKEVIKESTLHELQSSIIDNEDLRRKLGLEDNKSWMNTPI